MGTHFFFLYHNPSIPLEAFTAFETEKEGTKARGPRAAGTETARGATFLGLPQTTNLPGAAGAQVLAIGSATDVPAP
jgi:hypothetical protein